MQTSCAWLILVLVMYRINGGIKPQRISAFCRTLQPPLRAEWADTKGEGSCNSEVKSLHVSNLPENSTEDSLKEVFAPLGPLERVALLDHKSKGGASEPVKKRDYAFIHYEKRSTMLKVFEVRSPTCVYC